MSEKPNFIFIMVDQMRGDFFGADGCKVAQTPNLDSLAASGTRFNHAYSAVPSCLPARAILWSGQNQWHAGVLGMGWGQGPTPNDFPHTIPGELSKAGYRTHMVGKGHFSPQRSSMGFQSSELDESGRMEDSEHRRWFRENANPNVTPDDHGVNWNSWHSRPWHTEEYLHPTAWTMNRALEFLKTRDEKQPFFLNISFARPHSPYVPPKYYFDYYYNKELPEANVGEWASMHDDPETAANPNAWRGKMTKEEIHKARAGYLGEISFIDTQIGRLINWVGRHHEIANNTWFIFTSDHGDMQGDHNLWRKTYAYEGSARIPYIITPPRNCDMKTRKLAEEVVELRDIMPTVLDAAGVEIPKTVDGRSLLNVMQNSDENWREYIHGEHCKCYSHEQEMQYVTDGKRKFIWLPRIDVEQFFDLEEDPGEVNNLINDSSRKDEVDKWRNYMIKELEERDCGWVKDGKLYCTPDEPMVSPYKDVRWTQA
jgi:arylsulfatase A-like enzyme